MTDDNELTRDPSPRNPADDAPPPDLTSSGDWPRNPNDLLKRLGFDVGTHPSEAADASTMNQSPERARRAAELAAAIAVPGYEILGELGRGGMGVVFKAKQLKLNRVVALKMVLGGGYSSARMRFLAEAEAVAAVRHPHVVQVHAYGEHDGQPFLEFEYLPGGTLTERLKAGRLDPTTAAELVRQIAQGVGAAHEAEIVHRDIKPGNVLFDADGNPKVSDFGLAKRGASELTNTVAYLGTAFYMSAEQAEGKSKFVGPQTDVWALGVILYECLTGKRPFDGEETHEVLMSVVHDDPRPPRAHAPGVPRDLETVCLKCLQKEPHRRYPNAQAMAADLGLYLAGRPVTARPVGPLARLSRRVRRNPVLTGLILVVAAMGAGLFAMFVSNYNQALARAEFEEKAKDEARALAKRNEDLANEQTALRVEAGNELARADGVTDLLFGSFKTVDPIDLFGDGLGAQSWAKLAKEQNKTVKEFLREFGDRFNDTLKGPAAELTRARLLDGYGNAMKNLGDLGLAEKALREARDIRARRLPATHPSVWKSELDLGRLEVDVGHYLSGLARFRKVYASQTLTPEAERLGLTAKDIEVLRLKTKLYEGTTLGLLADKDAIRVLRELTTARTAVLGKHHAETLLAKLALLGFMLDYRMDDEVALMVPDLLETMNAQEDSRIRDLAKITGGLIASLTTARLGASFAPDAANRNAAAAIRTGIAEGEKVLPPNHFILSILRFELASLALKTGGAAEADALYARILPDLKVTLGVAHPKALVFLNSYADRLAESARLGEARRLYDEFDAANVERFGQVNHWRALLMLRRVELEADYESVEKALPFARHAIALVESEHFLSSHYSANYLMTAAKALTPPTAPRDAHAAGMKLFALTRPVVTRLYGDGCRELTILDLVEGRAAYQRGDRAAGAALLARAEAAMPALRPRLSDADTNLLLYARGEVERDRGRLPEAEQFFRTALKVSRGRIKRDPKSVAEDATELAGVLVEQGKFADAVPLLAEARRATAARKETAKDKTRELALADLVLVAVRHKTDPAAAAEGTRAMAKAFGDDGDAKVLSRVAWAVGLAPSADGTAAGLAAKLRPLLDKTPHAWGERSLALLHLRAGEFDAAEASLKKAGAPQPVDAVVRGLAAAARSDGAAARSFAADAERQLEAAKPSAAAPFAYAGSAWYDRLFARMLLEELRAKFAPPK